MLLPVVPAFGTDMAAEVAVHEEGVAIVAPRTAEVDLRGFTVGDETAVVEDVAIGLILGGGGSRHVGVDEALDGAAFEPRRGRTEDKIGGATDVAVLEEETGGSHACVDSVLMADKTAVDEHKTVAFGMEGHGLTQTGRVVLDGDVLQRDVVALNLQRVGTEGAHGL